MRIKYQFLLPIMIVSGVGYSSWAIASDLDGAPQSTLVVSQVAPYMEAQLKSKVLAGLAAAMDLSSYRETRVRFVGSGIERHAIVYLLSKMYHHFELARVSLNAKGEVTEVRPKYQLEANDRLVSRELPKCPDERVEFIAFAPNDLELEQDITKTVAQAAREAGLHTVELLKNQATRANYLNYMSCPRVVGNFYDGDANSESIVTVDGEITSEDMATEMKGAFRTKVTNIWLACQAFNNPILNTVIETASTQKYAAGKNDLLVGPSDNTAACAMQAALKGQPMAESFLECYNKLDNVNDHWGFDGHGSDYFGH